MVKKVISGGQSGADIAGVIAAREMGIETGGHMPLGFRTEDGPKPEYAELYNMEESYTSNYTLRTRLNVKNSDGTVIFGNTSSAGSKLTISMVEREDKVYLAIPLGTPKELAVKQLKMFIDTCDINILNVAGNRESVSPGIQIWAQEIIKGALHD